MSARTGLSLTRVHVLSVARLTGEIANLDRKTPTIATLRPGLAGAAWARSSGRATVARAPPAAARARSPRNSRLERRCFACHPASAARASASPVASLVCSANHATRIVRENWSNNGWRDMKLLVYATPTVPIVARGRRRMRRTSARTALSQIEVQDLSVRLSYRRDRKPGSKHATRSGRSSTSAAGAAEHVVTCVRDITCRLLRGCFDHLEKASSEIIRHGRRRPEAGARHLRAVRRRCCCYRPRRRESGARGCTTGASACLYERSQLSRKVREDRWREFPANPEVFWVPSWASARSLQTQEGWHRS